MYSKCTTQWEHIVIFKDATELTNSHVNHPIWLQIPLFHPQKGQDSYSAQKTLVHAFEYLSFIALLSTHLKTLGAIAKWFNSVEKSKYVVHKRTVCVCRFQEHSFSGMIAASRISLWWGRRQTQTIICASKYHSWERNTRSLKRTQKMTLQHFYVRLRYDTNTTETSVHLIPESIYHDNQSWWMTKLSFFEKTEWHILCDWLAICFSQQILPSFDGQCEFMS